MSKVNKASTFELNKISRFVSVKCNLPRRDKNYNYSFQMDSSYLDNFQNNNKLFVANNYLIKIFIFIIFEPSITFTSNWLLQQKEYFTYQIINYSNSSCIVLLQINNSYYHWNICNQYVHISKVLHSSTIIKGEFIYFPNRFA